MIDTHSHIQFKIFDSDRAEVIKRAKEVGVDKIVAVGTDLDSSQKAVEVAQEFPNVYAAVGIHPHHAFKYQSSAISFQPDIKNIENLLENPKIIAIGECGMDAHPYPKTKYVDYEISEEFLKMQKLIFVEQIKLAKKHQKTLIVHNRAAVFQLLEVLAEHWDPFFEGRAVFHCCEPDERLLQFAIQNHVFIGVDGDVTYDKIKQEFIKNVPLDLLVLETDSPFFVPEPFKSSTIVRNEPKSIVTIINFIEKLVGDNVQRMSRINSKILYKLPHG